MNLQLRPPDPQIADSPSAFDYSAAFSRNIGWITEWEQQELRRKTVAIAGMGGVGGAHALTLARLGIGGLHIADLDRFDIVNMNRQAGAFVSTIDREKTAVMAEMTRDINPELRQTVFAQGLSDENLDSFLSGVDLFVDGLDFFVIGIRRKVFKRCAELGIPAITAAPIGFGSSYLLFMPGGMSFEEYFRFDGLTEEQQYVNFALGLSPRGLHRAYMVDPSRVDLAGKRGPSTAAAIQLSAGIVGVEAVKILLGRGKVDPAPVYHQFDAYRGRWVRGKLRFGNAGPLQLLKRRVGYRAFARLSRNARPPEAPVVGSEIERILDLARWAPSGDNAQPWRFAFEDDRVVIHVKPKRDIYDYNDGQPSLLSAGMLLETLRIAASSFGRATEWSHSGSEGDTYRILVRLPRRPHVIPDPLCAYIKVRSVDRRRYRLGPLGASQKTLLELALSPTLRVVWHESARERLRQSRLNACSSDIRLRVRAAYDVHREVLRWDEPFTRTGIPVHAIGIDPLTMRLMRRVMQAWERQDFFNRFLFGTLMPRIQLDFIPGIRSAAHFTIFRTEASEKTGDQVTDLLKEGMHLQRFWLTATKLGLAVQPTLSPIIFSHHAKRADDRLSNTYLMKRAAALARALGSKGSIEDMIFRGRVGMPKRRPPASRSIRLRLADLISPRNEVSGAERNCD